MTIAEYGHVDLFRSGVLSNISSWGRSDIVWLSYYNFLFHGESSKFVRLPRTRPSTKTLDLRNLTSHRALDTLTKFGVHLNKSLGGVR